MVCSHEKTDARFVLACRKRARLIYWSDQLCRRQGSRGAQALTLQHPGHPLPQLSEAAIVCKCVCRCNGAINQLLHVI